MTSRERRRKQRARGMERRRPGPEDQAVAVRYWLAGDMPPGPYERTGCTECQPSFGGEWPPLWAVIFYDRPGLPVVAELHIPGCHELARLRAVSRRHTPVHDGPARWTCTDCGAAVLVRNGNTYGSAVEADCPGKATR